MEDVYLQFADANLMLVNRQFIVGAGILNDNLTAWFNNEALHSPPVALQMMHNALLATFAESRVYNISLTNFPLPYTDETRVRTEGFTFLSLRIKFNLIFFAAPTDAHLQ